MLVSKNKIFNINSDEINVYKIAMFFENGMNDIIDQDMIDYGLPNELLKVLNDYKIIITKNTDIDKIEFIDEYQKLILKDFVEVMLK